MELVCIALVVDIGCEQFSLAAENIFVCELVDLGTL